MKQGSLGFTLLEVVIASFLFSGIITVLGGVWVLHARAQAQSSHLLVAADLADLEMNRALAQGFHDVTSSSGQYVQTWEIRGQQIEQDFQSKVDVIDLLVPDEPLRLKLVQVVVSFKDGASREPRTFSLESIITDES